MIVALPLLFVLASPPPADELAGPAPVALDQVLAFAHQHAPTVLAAAHRIGAAVARADAADPWPEPQLKLGFSPLPIETRNGPAWASVSLTQAIPWTDALDARRAVAEFEAKASEHDRVLALLDIEDTVLVAWHRLAMNRAQVAINARMHTIATRVLRTAEDRLGVDAGRQGDVIRAQVEVARLETAAVDLAQRAVTLTAGLNAAIGRDARAPIGPLAPLAPTPESDLDAALDAVARHPALARHDARIEAARARLQHAETRGRPAFAVGLGYTLIGEPDGMATDAGRDALSINVGVTLPLWNGAIDDAERTAATEAVEAERAARAATADALARRVVEQAAAAETALRRLNLYRQTALPLAEQSLEVSLAAYASGRAAIERVLDAERTREQFEVEAAHAAAAFEIARALLARADGRPLVVEEEARGE